MAEKDGWESIQKYMASYGHKMEVTAAGFGSKYQRTEVGASSSIPLDSGANLDMLPASPPAVTGSSGVGLRPTFDGDNLAELLRQETLKNDRLVYQVRAFESSSATWIQEKRQLNDALRTKLDENNSLQSIIKQEQIKYDALSYDLAQMTDKYQASVDSAANAPTSPLATSAIMVSDITPDMQLTIMETINSMSHELLIEFYNENVCPPSTPEVAPPEALSSAPVSKKPPDKIRKSKPMTAMALILQTVTLLSALKPVDASGGDIFEVEKIVSLRHSDGTYEIKWKGYPTSGNTFEPKCNLHCIGMVQSFHWLNDLPAINPTDFGTPPPSPLNSTPDASPEPLPLSVAPSPNISVSAATMGCSPSVVSEFKSSKELMFADPAVISPSALRLRSGLCGNLTYVSESEPSSSSALPKLETRTSSYHPAGDSNRLAERAKALMDLILSSEKWMEAIVGGVEALKATPSTEFLPALRRHILLIGGKSGDNIQRFLLAFDKYLEYRVMRKITTPAIPIPGAVFSNMSIAEMETSPAWLMGKGTSIAPRIIQTIEWAQRSFHLPIYETNLTKSVPKHVPAADGSTRACGLGVWRGAEILSCSTSHSLPIVYFARIWVCMVLTSCRAACWMRCSIFSDWLIKGAAVIFNISITKSHDERNTKVALDGTGIAGELQWMQGEFQKQFAMYGSHPHCIDATGKRCSLTRATGLTMNESFTSADESEFRCNIYALFFVLGISEIVRKTMKLTCHSGHATFSAIGGILMWHSTVRDKLGRWARGSPEGYAHRQACEVQLNIRACLLAATRSILSHFQGKLPLDDDFTPISGYSELRSNEFYGPSAI